MCNTHEKLHCNSTGNIYSSVRVGLILAAADGCFFFHCWCATNEEQAQQEKHKLIRRAVK